MKLFRYRKPSIKTILGITKAKRKVKKSLGISQIEGFIKPSRVKQKIKYRLGFYTPLMTFLRQTSKGKFRTPGGI